MRRCGLAGQKKLVGCDLAGIGEIQAEISGTCMLWGEESRSGDNYDELTMTPPRFRQTYEARGIGDTGKHSQKTGAIGDSKGNTAGVSNRKRSWQT